MILSNTERKEKFTQIKNLNNSKTVKSFNDIKIIKSPSAKSNMIEIKNKLFSPRSIANVLSPSPSLRPFPILNNEFYNENNNILWEAEKEKLKVEKSLTRLNSERKYLKNNMFIFNKVIYIIINSWLFI